MGGARRVMWNWNGTLLVGHCGKDLVSPLDLPYVIDRLRVRRDVIAVLFDRPFPGVVTGQRQADIAVEHVQQHAQVTRAGVYVLLWVEDVRHAESRGGQIGRASCRERV